MCLVLGKFRNFIPRLVRKDMTVYKVMDVSTIQYGHVSSPYRGFLYKLGTLYKSVMFPTIRDIGPYWTDYFKVCIEYGFHAFPTVEEARSLLPDIASDFRNEWRSSAMGGRITIVECTIPKGSFIFHGFWNKGYWRGRRINNIVSNRLIITKEYT